MPAFFIIIHILYILKHHVLTFYKIVSLKMLYNLSFQINYRLLIKYLIKNIYFLRILFFLLNFPENFEAPTA